MSYFADRRLLPGVSLQTGKPTSELIVLSASRDLPVRKLRGFAASIGASARLVGSPGEILLPTPLDVSSTVANPKRPVMVLWDMATITLTSNEIKALGAAAFLVAVGDPEKLAVASAKPSVANDHSTDWLQAIRMTLSCKWPLGRLLDTQIARVVFGQAISGQGSLDGFALLRWGHHGSTWPSTETSLKDAPSITPSGIAATFSKQISAQGDLRKKLVAIARLFDGYGTKSRGQPASLTFASDGLLTCAIATCDEDMKKRLDLDADTLQKLGCQAVIMSEQESRVWQIAYVFAHHATIAVATTDNDLPLTSPMMVLFPKKDESPDTKTVPTISAAS